MQSEEPSASLPKETSSKVLIEERKREFPTRKETQQRPPLPVPSQGGGPNDSKCHRGNGPASANQNAPHAQESARETNPDCE